jgi:ATP-dependent exoDNAse (exonuclease V) beta subunit
MSAWMMLQRNLLYTAVTRAKQSVVLAGSRRAPAESDQATAVTERVLPQPTVPRPSVRVGDQLQHPPGGLRGGDWSALASGGG